MRIRAQASEKRTGFLQPLRLGANAATPRQKVFGLDGNGVTRGSEKLEGQPPVLVDADDGERLRPNFGPRRKRAPTGSADADDGRRLRLDFGPRRKQAMAVRLSGSFLREPHGASASCPGGNDPTPAMALRTMIAGSSWTAGKVATDSRRNAPANRRWPRWKGAQAPDQQRQNVTSHPETAVAKSNVRSVSESGARERFRASFAYPVPPESLDHRKTEGLAATDLG